MKKQRQEIMGVNEMNAILKGDNHVLGLREFRTSVSEIFEKAINGFQEILIGNVKKGGKTVSIISTDLLKEILETYKFNPEISYDEDTKQYEIILNEIPVTGFGSTKEEAIEMMIENTIALTEDYFENIELYARLEETKNQYAYYLRIKHCENSNEIMKVMNLDK